MLASWRLNISKLMDGCVTQRSYIEKYVVEFYNRISFFNRIYREKYCRLCSYDRWLII